MGLLSERNIAGSIRGGKFGRRGDDLYKLTKHWQNLLELARARTIRVDDVMIVEPRYAMEHIWW